MLWYIFVCSMIGGISVSVTSGLGAAIVTTAYGDNQVRYSLPLLPGPSKADDGRSFDIGSSISYWLLLLSH